MKEYSELVLSTPQEVEAQLKKYNVSSVDELASTLYRLYHVQVIDLTSESEYTQDNAQNSRAFADEAVTFEELQELQDTRNIYH